MAATRGSAAETGVYKLMFKKKNKILAVLMAAALCVHSPAPAALAETWDPQPVAAVPDDRADARAIQ